MKETPFGPLATPGTDGPDPDSYWVVPTRLGAGPYPHSPDPKAGREKIERLAATGITAFVNLTEDAVPGSTDAHLIPYLDTLATVVPTSVVVARPIRDLDVPTREEMIGTLDDIDHLLCDGHGVYVHCWGGIGRTGTVIGCWLIRHRLTIPEAALDMVARLRMGIGGYRGRRSPETLEQCDFVEAWRPGS